MATWGYIPKENRLKDFTSRIIGYPHPLGRVAANIVKQYANFNSQHTLDIGCDAGIYTIEFLKRGIKAVTGIDLNEVNLKLAKKNLAKFDLSANILKADAQKLPFADNTFDQVICLMVLEHVKEPNMLLAEIHRVLVPSGQLILSVPNELYLTKPIIPYDFSEILKAIEHEHAGYYLGDLEKMFTKNNLSIIKHKYYNKFFSRLITELLYIILGTNRNNTRDNMVRENWSMMFIFVVVYSLFQLDRLDFRKKGGCIVVNSINNK